MEKAAIQISTLLIGAFLLTSCSGSDSSLIGTRWKVDVFYSADGSYYEPAPDHDWDVTFEPFEITTDFAGEARMKIVFPCGDTLAIPFILNDSSFVVEKNLVAVGIVDGDGTCVPDPQLPALGSMDYMFNSSSNSSEYLFEAIKQSTRRITSSNNDVLEISKVD